MHVPIVGCTLQKTKQITENSLHYIKDHLDQKAMKAFAYSYPPDDEMEEFYVGIPL